MLAHGHVSNSRAVKETLDLGGLAEPALRGGVCTSKSPWLEMSEK